jgi:hypothetical protein
MQFLFALKHHADVALNIKANAALIDRHHWLPEGVHQRDEGSDRTQ